MGRQEGGIGGPSPVRGPRGRDLRGKVGIVTVRM